MPSTPSSSAVQPIAARTVSELRSGCRRNRQASSTASTGRIQDSEPNPSTAAVWMARPTALPIRAHSEAPSTMASAQGEQPHAVAAVVRVQVARAAADGPGGEPDRPGDEHPGGRDHLAGPADQDHDGIAGRAGRGGTAFRRAALARARLAGRFPVALLFRLFGPERVWLPCPCLRRGAWRAGDLVAAERSAGSGAASSSPPRERADPLRARVAILTNVARTRSHPKHRRGVSRLWRNHVVVSMRVAEAASLVERAGRGVARLDLEQHPARPLTGRRGGQARGRGWRGGWDGWDER